MRRMFMCSSIGNELAPQSEGNENYVFICTI